MATAPYDVIETILQSTRVRVNDAIQQIGGNTLTDTADFTPIYVNTAWRVLQNKLRAIGYTGFARLKDDLIISALPASASSDPAVQNYITWAGFYNGSTVNGAVVLPQEFMQPLVLWERPNASANSIPAQNFRLMDQTLNGIPTNGPKQSRNLNWDWRNDQLCFPGTTVVWDLRVRCLTFLPDFPVTPGGEIITTTAVPILDCLDPFSNLIAVEFSRARGDLDTAAFASAADSGIAALYSRDTNQPTAMHKPSEYGTMRNAYTPGVSVAPAAPQAPAQGGSQ